MAVLLLFVLATVCISAPINRDKFKESIVSDVEEKLEGLNLTSVILELDYYREKIKDLDDHDFRDRLGNDGFLGVLDPGSSIPGSRYLGKHLSTFIEVLQLGQVAYEVENSVFGGASCTACKAGLMFLNYYLHSGVTLEQVIRDTNVMCSTFRMVSPRMCTGLVESFGPEIYTVVSNISQSPEEMCGFMFGEACNNPYNPKHEWTVLLPPVLKPVVSDHKTSGADTFRVLQLSDTHWDPFYQEGSNANCGEPLCCRSTSSPVIDPSDKAGYWGDYRKCDTPLRTIESMYRHISKTHPDIELIYWTGDLPPHDIWNQTRQGNLEVLRETSKQLRQHFPDKVILPALGNHESAPVDSFPPPFVHGDHSISWLYSAVDTEWTTWIGAGHGPTLRYGGYFSVNTGPGLRVISLNMNYCMNKNIWLLMNSTDPAEELKWLVYELQLAEFKDEKVHIIGHIPPGHVDCVAVWSRNYNRIINRYENTVTAQFFGHTHADEFQLFYDLENRTRPINIAYIGPSVTPYYGLNPTYRIYDVSESSGRVINHETWYMDLEKANANPNQEPVWEKLYSVLEDYQLPSLSLDSWHNYVKIIQNDYEAFDKFYFNYHAGSRERPDCDPICRRKIICNLRTSQSHNSKETCKDENSLSYFDWNYWF
jgi:sphingomyelin phosphodiesterase